MCVGGGGEVKGEGEKPVTRTSALGVWSDIEEQMVLVCVW